MGSLGARDDGHQLQGTVGADAVGFCHCWCLRWPPASPEHSLNAEDTGDGLCSSSGRNGACWLKPASTCRPLATAVGSWVDIWSKQNGLRTSALIAERWVFSFSL